MATKIRSDDFQNLLHCQLKTYFKLRSQSGLESDYEALQKEHKRQVRQKSIEKIRYTYDADDLTTTLSIKRGALSSGFAFVLDGKLINQRYAMHFDGLKRVNGHSALGDFHYAPVIFAEPRRVGRPQRLLLEILALLLSPVQGKTPRMGIVYHGPDCKVTTVRFSTRLTHGEALRDDMVRLVASETPPKLLLNNHCSVCEFRERCYTQAIQEDNLSLIRGIGEKEITRYSRKGLLTLTQLAHTFRPRRDPKQTSRLRTQRYHALHAMALRDRKIYILGKPQLPSNSVQIFLDMEGDPEQGFIYLIGVIVCDGGREKRYSFWAHDRTEEERIFNELFTLVERFEDVVIFVYGSYEKSALTRVRNYTRNIRSADKVLSALVNVLSIIYAHFYMPTYSNSLKEVGDLLGFTWRHGIRSGIDSIVARSRWEITHEEKFKFSLMEYNLEDCTALHRVTNFLRIACGETPIAPVAAFDGPTQTPLPAVLNVNAFQKSDKFPRAGRPHFVHPDFEFINERAHFNYQQLRVYVRSSKTSKKRVSRTLTSHNRRLRISQQIQIDASVCPKCGDTNLSAMPRECRAAGARTRQRRIFDLVITPSCTKRRVIQCSAPAYQCMRCGHRFVSDEYYRIAKHSHAVMSWAMYQHISHQLSLRTLEELFEEFFGLRVGKSEIHLFKPMMALYYRDAWRGVMERLLAGNVLHIDETEVRLRTGKGYVWVFASFDRVVYMYRPTREGGFLQETLGKFKGVLVTDFYAAYDSLDCPQQKCLIHLIRDMNQALLEHQFDVELESIVTPFGSLLRSIIAMVDEHGLRRRHLAKYVRKVAKFFRGILSRKFQSEGAIALQQRLIKNRERLFTFLKYDGVPWNNNPAENAIRQFAYYREETVGVMSEEGIKDYLVLLSIYQTCKYNGTSFLKFLLSKERDVETFCITRRKSKQSRSIELYPADFSISNHPRPKLAVHNGDANRVGSLPSE